MALKNVIGIDHAVVVVRDLDKAAENWKRLGFTVSPRGTHSAKMGSGNYTIMLDPDYIELLGVLVETEHNAPARAFLDRLLAGNGPVHRVVPVDVRQSMANGGGPACLRLRVVADPATIDPRFLLDEAKAEIIERAIAGAWPEQIDTADIGKETLARAVVDARRVLLEAINLNALA